jgi:hypothetical protein
VANHSPTARCKAAGRGRAFTRKSGPSKIGMSRTAALETTAAASDTTASPDTAAAHSAACVYAFSR